MNIGQRIRLKREELNMTQEELAHKTGYKSRSSINKIEGDGRSLPQSKILSFAQALNTTPSYLMGWENAKVTEDIENGITIIDPIYPKDEKQLLREFKKLNDIGRQKAIERVSELVEIPRYIKAVDTLDDADFPEHIMPIAAHANDSYTEEELQHDLDIMDDENF